MRKLILVSALILVLPSSSFAWGSGAHRFIMDRAIELLPPEIKPFFVEHRDEVVMRVVDPDLWRTLGWDEDPNHFMNFGVPEFGPYPFDALPHEYGAAIEKFGLATLKKNGLIPWREAEEFGNLRRAFESFGKGQGFGAGDTVLFAAVVSHYVQDSHQPLHATNNYDGNLSNQLGVHSRFESVLFDRFKDRLTITPAAGAAVKHPTEEAFAALLSGYKLVDPILAADKDAIGTKDTYDDEYFEQFFTKVKSILDERLTLSIVKTAATIAGAWEAAGRPVLKAPGARPPQKVKKAGTNR